MGPEGVRQIQDPAPPLRVGAEVRPFKPLITDARLVDKVNRRRGQQGGGAMVGEEEDAGGPGPSVGLADSKHQQNDPDYYAPLWVPFDQSPPVDVMPEGELFTLQLPSLLPPMQPSGQPLPISDLPNGQVGVLRLYKSGKVTLVVGALEYNVDQGISPAFFQEVVCLDSDQNELIALGQPRSTLTATPDLRALG
jgi:hypothetical protein